MAMLMLAVCIFTGTEIAYWLFCTTKITGTFHTPAKLSASWKSPSDVPPSPTNAIATSSFFWYLIAYPMPDACRSWDAIGTEEGSM